MRSCEHTTQVTSEQINAEIVLARVRGLGRHVRPLLNNLEVDCLAEIFVGQRDIVSVSLALNTAMTV